jgi:hypothetical protein
MALQPFVGSSPLFGFLILCTVGKTPWMGDRPVVRPLPIHRTTKAQNKHTEIFMPRVRFESKIQLLVRVKRFMPQTARPFWSALCFLCLTKHTNYHLYFQKSCLILLKIIKLVIIYSAECSVLKVSLSGRFICAIMSRRRVRSTKSQRTHVAICSVQTAA